MRYLLVIFYLLLMQACGTAEHQKEKSEAVKRKTPAVKAKINEKAIAAKAFINAPYATPTPSPTAEPTDDKVVVLGAPTATTLPVVSLPNGVDYVAAPVNWADAMMKAPAGKRLATRDELFALWDSGALKGLHFSTGVIWTANAKDSSEAWCLSTYDGSLAYSSMGGMLSAVYVNQ